jgi:hypothetical protein
MNYLFIKICSSYLITTLERVEVGATPNNITIVIPKAMANYVGLTNKDMTSKWICFGCDGNVVF